MGKGGMKRGGEDVSQKKGGGGARVGEEGLCGRLRGAWVRGGGEIEGRERKF